MNAGIFLISWAFALFGMYLGYKMGYEEGHEKGYNLAKITYMIVIDGYRRRLGLENEDEREETDG